MTTLYFTSTGNCLYVAKTLGGRALSIATALRTGQLSFADDAIGLVFPVYSLSVPPLVLEFLAQAELKADYLFAVLTYGTYAAGAAQQLEQAARSRGLTFTYVNTLHMQENYLPGFAMERQKAPANQQARLTAIASAVQSQTRFIKHSSAFARFMTRAHQKNYHYKRGAGVTAQMQVTGHCIGCGICAHLCPTANIQIQNGTPVFGGDCLSCLACVQSCPHAALHLQTERARRGIAARR